MSGWDGAGSFTRVYDWTDDRDGGIKILASRFDSENDTFAAGIQACLTKNGENSATANLNLGGFRFTNAGNATARTDLARVSQVQDAAYVTASAGGTADALTASLAPAITAYAEGPVYAIVPASNNATTTPTLNLNSIGAKTIVKFGSTALAAGDLVADELALLTYNATDDNINLLNPATAQAVDTALQNVVEDTTPQAGGTFDLNGNDILLTKGGDIASASPLVIDTDGSYFDVTGTTGFSAMTVAAGAFFVLQFDGALTITHGSGITLPGGANITTVAGDQALCYATAANTVTVISYVRASVSPVPMTQAQAEAGTDTTPRPVAAEQIAQAIAAQTTSGVTWLGSQASTSGTSINFTSIPSTASLIIVSFQAMSLDSGAVTLVQIGDSGGLETSGYDSGGNVAATETTSTSGFVMYTAAATNQVRGWMMLSHEGSNKWNASHVCSTNGGILGGGGTKTLSATLDRLSVVAGSGNFDAGAINVGYL